MELESSRYGSSRSPRHGHIRLPTNGAQKGFSIPKTRLNLRLGWWPILRVQPWLSWPYLEVRFRNWENPFHLSSLSLLRSMQAPFSMSSRFHGSRSCLPAFIGSVSVSIPSYHLCCSCNPILWAVYMDGSDIAYSISCFHGPI